MNAARELANLLEAWGLQSKPNNTAYAWRGTDDGVDGWSRYTQVVTLLSQIEQALADLTSAGVPVEHYRRNFPEWARAVFLPEIAWGHATPATQNVISRTSLDNLLALADRLDHTQATFVLEGPARVSVRSALEEVADLIKGLPLDLAARRYIFELINSVRTLVDEQAATGSIDLLHRIHELFGVLSNLSDELTRDPNTTTIGKKLGELARKIMPVASYLTGAAVTGIAVAADIHELTAQ